MLTYTTFSKDSPQALHDTCLVSSFSSRSNVPNRGTSSQGGSRARFSSSLSSTGAIVAANLVDAADARLSTRSRMANRKAVCRAAGATVLRALRRWLEMLVNDTTATGRAITAMLKHRVSPGHNDVSGPRMLLLCWQRMSPRPSLPLTHRWDVVLLSKTLSLNGVHRIIAAYVRKAGDDSPGFGARTTARNSTPQQHHNTASGSELNIAFGQKWPCAPQQKVTRLDLGALSVNGNFRCPLADALPSTVMGWLFLLLILARSRVSCFAKMHLIYCFYSL